MCSVNFIYQPNLPENSLRKAIGSMVSSSKHRGPDATEVLIGNNYALGFNRLQIIGGGLGGQPIYDNKNGLLLVCNGEIFNYKKLRKDYFRNELFLTESDVEVILHLYKKFGEKSITYLEGQFSYLIYDLNKSQIILGKDRFGINPLFYYAHRGVFIAASEIKSILSSGITKDVTLNQKGIIENLFFYGTIPPNTCFTKIIQVPPATYVTYNTSSSELKTVKYWEISSSKKIKKDMKLSSKKLKRLLSRSVKSRLQGESIPGVYLSGGLDSSVIACLVKQLSKQTTRFFSIAFDDKRYDESKFQKQIANNLNVQLIQIKITYKDIIKNLRKCIYHVETPLIRTAPVPMLLLSKKVKETGTKFVLCGEGADEVFAGYPVFAKDKASIEDKWNTISKYVYIFANKNLNSYVVNVKKKIIENNQDKNRLSHNRKKEIATKLSQYLLVNQGDRMSMANGIEQRFPFLDTDIVNYAFSLDDALLISGKQGKKILNETFKNELPKTIIRRKKQGYLAPDDKVVKVLLENTNYSKLLNKLYFETVKMFDYSKAKVIINKVKNNKAHGFEVNIVLFILTTHMLYYLFITKLPQQSNRQSLLKKHT